MTQQELMAALSTDETLAAAFSGMLQEPALAKINLTDWEFRLACEAPIVFERYRGFTWKQRRALREILKKIVGEL